MGFVTVCNFNGMAHLEPPYWVGTSRIAVPGYRRTAIRRWPRLGYCTLGWAWTLTVSAEGRRKTLQAIHAPLIATTAAPAGTVGGVL